MSKLYFQVDLICQNRHLVSYRRVPGSIFFPHFFLFFDSVPLLFRSNFQSLQMRSLPTLDPYIFLIFICKMSLLDLFLSGNCFLIFRVLWWGHKRGFKIMGTWCSRSTWACNATQYVAILVNHWTSASDTMVIFLLTFLVFPSFSRDSEIPGTHLFYGFPPLSEKEEPLREMPPL